MRLIDADALQAIYKRNSITEKIMVLDKSPMQHLIDAPTVDAVEVVRCKDCKKGRLYCFENDYGSTAEVFCNLIGGYMQPKDFCSYGERKDKYA